MPVVALDSIVLLLSPSLVGADLKTNSSELYHAISLWILVFSWYLVTRALIANGKFAQIIERFSLLSQNERRVNDELYLASVKNFCSSMTLMKESFKWIAHLTVYLLIVMPWFKARDPTKIDIVSLRYAIDERAKKFLLLGCGSIKLMQDIIWLFNGPREMIVYLSKWEVFTRDLSNGQTAVRIGNRWTNNIQQYNRASDTGSPLTTDNRWNRKKFREFLLIILDEQ